MKPKWYWTEEKCYEEALKYTKRDDFQKRSSGAYAAARRLKILDKVCSHMTYQKQLPNGYWNLKTITKEAQKYYSRSKFCKENNSAYNAAKRLNILENVCSHMLRQGSKYNRFIYKVIFPDSSIYIGLTCNFERRKWQHLNEKGTVYDHIIKTNTEPIFEIISELLPREEASKLEKKLILEHINKGFKILNQAKGGSLGRDINKWSIEELMQIALKYSNRNEFLKKDSSAYRAAYTRGLLDTICSHMFPVHITWTENKIKEEALKYTSRSKFRDGSQYAYEISRRRGILNIVCSHMKKI